MRIFNHIVLFVVLWANILAVYILYLMFIPITPVKFFNSPFPVETKQVKRGGQLIYSPSHCKYIDTPGKVSRSLVDGFQYTLPEVVASVPKGCAALRVMSVTIPPTTPPGKYYLNISVTYEMNPFRHYTVNVRTQEFEVIK